MVEVEIYSGIKPPVTERHIFYELVIKTPSPSETTSYPSNSLFLPTSINHALHFPLDNPPPINPTPQSTATSPLNNILHDNQRPALLRNKYSAPKNTRHLPHHPRLLVLSSPATWDHIPPHKVRPRPHNPARNQPSLPPAHTSARRSLHRQIIHASFSTARSIVPSKNPPLQIHLIHPPHLWFS